MRLLTVTTLLGQTAVTQSSLLHSYFSQCDLPLEQSCVFATGTSTVLSTYLTSTETFTIHLQTKSFLTVTTHFLFLSRVGDSLSQR